LTFIHNILTFSQKYLRVIRLNKQGEFKMSLINSIKGTIGALTELAIMLLALAIAVQLLVGSGNMSFFGSVVSNFISLVNQLGNAGLAGLISVGIIMWLFGKK
jgi:hypothetical protein